MKILKIILHKYKRLSLNNINTLIYTPDSKINIILGSNGSGKSSLLRELSPLPADIKNDYKSGGYKEIHILANNSKYILKSGPTKGKYSFIKDGKELNVGGTKKIQLMLIKEELQYENFHDILTGVKTFTTMTTQERKNWFTKIANTDYTFALKVFNDLKIRQRDIKGGLKILKNKLPSKDILEADYKDIEEKKFKLEKLNEFKDVIVRSFKDTFESKDLKTISREFFNKYKAVNDKMKDIDLDIDLSKTNLTEEINNTESDIQVNQKFLTVLLQDFDKIEEKSKLKYDNIDEIDKKIKTYENELKLGLDNIPLDLNINEVENLYYYFKSNLQILTESIIELKDYDKETKDLNITDLNFNLDTQNNNFVKVNKLLDNLKLKIDEQEHFKEHNETQCPNCSFKWYRGFDREVYEGLKERTETLQEKKIEIKDKIKDLEEKVNNKKEYLNLLNRIKNILGLHSKFEEYFSKCISDYTEDEDFSKLDRKLFNINSSVTELFNKLYLVKEIKSLENDKEILSKENNKDNIKNQEDIIKEIDKTKEVISNKKHYLDKLNSLDRLLKIKKKLNTDLQKLFKYRNKLINNLENIERNKALDNILLAVKEEIVDLERNINSAEYHIKVTKNLTKEIEDLEHKEEAVKILLDTLSPNGGLIAKSITMFLDLFIEDINNIIKSVWSYDLEVSNCTIEDGKDLSYEFPVNVNNSNQVKDVKDTSASMNEIIDLAFKIVSMKYLKLEKYPLFLDEYGRTMDNVHRIKAFNIVDMISDTTFDQIFIVSHFESVYTRFKNSDITVLSEDNLNLDSKIEYNKQLVINP